ncbi:hypothetical protein K2X05_06435 [bacterium]|nr:hypothetical protein [bacterium]
MNEIIQFKWRILSLLTIFVLVGCSDDNKGQEGQTNDKQTYFKSVGGQDAELLPLVAIRKYDNQISMYSIWKDCGKMDMKLHSSQTPLPLVKKELPGPFFSGPSCTIEIKYDYSSGVPFVVGKNGVREIDVQLKSLSKDEFINEMKSVEVAFPDYYKSQTSFNQRTTLDNMCEDLFDQKCANLF